MKWTSIFVVLIGGLAVFQCTKNPSSSDAQLTLSVSVLTFDTIDQTTKTITVGNSGGGDLTWNAQETTDVPWITLSTSSGQAGDPLTVTIDRGNLDSGTHNATIRVSSNGGNIDLTVTALISELFITESLINFESFESSKDIEIQNIGAGILNWTISVTGIPWLSISETSGDNAGSVTLTVDRDAVTTGRHFGSLLISSTGGDLSIDVSVSKLPTSIFLEEFSSGLANWEISEATGTINGGLLELSATSSTSLGQAAHLLTSLKAAPWLYRVTIGKKNDIQESISSVAVLTDDDVTSSNIVIPAYRFDIISNDNEFNWIAGGFVFNASTLEGQWGFFENGIGTSSQIATEVGEINDISLAMTDQKMLEVYVDGSLFFQTDDILELEDEIGEEITVNLDQLFLWTGPEVTVIADWALVRDADVPGKMPVSSGALPDSRRELVDYARKTAFKQFDKGSHGMIPMREAINRIK